MGGLDIEAGAGLLHGERIHHTIRATPSTGEERLHITDQRIIHVRRRLFHERRVVMGLDRVQGLVFDTAVDWSIVAGLVFVAGLGGTLFSFGFQGDTLTKGVRLLLILAGAFLGFSGLAALPFARTVALRIVNPTLSILMSARGVPKAELHFLEAVVHGAGPSTRVTLRAASQAIHPGGHEASASTAAPAPGTS